MEDILRKVCDLARQRGLKFADARIVLEDRTYISRQDGRADRMSANRSSGLGIRVLHRGSWGFASTNTLSMQSAAECLEEATAAARLSEDGADFELSPVDPREAEARTPVQRDPRSVPAAEKMELLRRHEAEALRIAADKAVNTVVSLGDSVTRTLVCSTEGVFVDQEQVRATIAARVVTADGEVRQASHEIRSRLAGWETFDDLEPMDIGGKAAEKAVRLLSAKKAPAGVFPVVLHPTVVGVFIHEAFGHNAEADLILAGESILEGKLGHSVASELVNVVDDATLPQLWGSYAYDSEGTPAQRRQIIRNGELVGLMHSRESAGRMGLPPNGSARADGYHSMPIVRMSNTMLEAGETPVEEIIAGVDEGVLFEDGRWGYVFCQKGQYTLNAGCGRMIRRGELAETVRDVCMCGMVIETIHKVDAVSKEFELAWGGGMCGKNGQSMPVSGGGPYVRVADMVVGGQERA